jgi:hypothetical protein
MGTSLNGLTPAGTYPGLIKTGDNAPIDGTLKTLSDGNGNNLPMAVSTTTINLTGTAQVGGVAIANTTQVAAKQDTLVSGTNIKTINGASLLGSGDIPVVTSPSGVAGAIQFPMAQRLQVMPQIYFGMIPIIGWELVRMRQLKHLPLMQIQLMTV